MPEPCRSCPEKSKDLGGCRCQAFMLTGRVDATDPVCDKSPDHSLVLRAMAAGGDGAASPLLFRSPENSRLLLGERSGSGAA
jgi:PqqA peptide cyclase